MGGDVIYWHTRAREPLLNQNKKPVCNTAHVSYHAVEGISVITYLNVLSLDFLSLSRKFDDDFEGGKFLLCFRGEEKKKGGGSIMNRKTESFN